MAERISMTLQSTQNWLTKKCNFYKGCLIIVNTEATDRGQWPIVIIKDSQVAAESLVRTVNFRTLSSIMC